jgi:uncharacterized protein YxjI
MRLFLKREVSNADSAFVIYDESGELKYRAVFYGTKNKKPAPLIVIADCRGDAVSKIRCLRLMNANVYVLKAYKKHLTFVTVATQKGVYSYFYGNNWHINGSIIQKNFEVIDVDKSLIMTHKKTRGYCELEIIDESRELFCVSAAVCANLISIAGRLAPQTV